MVDITSLIRLQKIGGVNGIHSIRVDWDEEARNGKANETNDNEDESGILNSVSELGNVLDDEIDYEDGQEGDSQSNQEGEELNNQRITVWTTATTELVAIELILTVKARPAAVQ